LRGRRRSDRKYAGHQDREKPTPHGKPPPTSRLEHDPEKHALGLDPRVETDFPKRSCSIKKLERQSIQSETIALWEL
jgi:hypothetical protein